MFNKLKNWIRGRKGIVLDFRYVVITKSYCNVSKDASEYKKKYTSKLDGILYRNAVRKCIVESLGLDTSRVYFPVCDEYRTVPTGDIYDTYDEALEVAYTSGLLAKTIRLPELNPVTNPIPELSIEEQQEIRELEANPRKIRKLTKKLLEDK